MSVTIYVEKMTKCSVLFCTNYSNRAPGVSFHRFPIDPARKREWVKAVRREKTWIPRKHTSICSIHFEPECFNHNSKKQRKLFKDAVPTLNLPEFSHETNILKSESSFVDQPQERDKSQSLEITESQKREFMRKIQRQAKKIKRLHYLNRCLKKKITVLEEALENATNT